MKNREKQRTNKRQTKREEALGRENMWGNRDMTPYNAIRDMNGKDIKYK